MDVSRDKVLQLLTIDSVEVRLPGRPKSVATFDDVVVVVLGGREIDRDEVVPSRARDMENHVPDFELSNPEGRIAGIDGDGGLLWVSSSSAEPGEKYQFKSCHQFHDRCLCSCTGRDASQGWIEIDPNSGEVRDEYPKDSLRIGGSIRVFQRPVMGFLTVDAYGIVKLRSKDDSRLWTGIAFDKAENELWNREFAVWYLREENGVLVSQIEHRMGAKTLFEHDLETGEPCTIRNTIANNRGELQKWLPPQMHHLIDGYLERINDENDG